MKSKRLIIMAIVGLVSISFILILLQIRHPTDISTQPRELFSEVYKDDTVERIYLNPDGSMTKVVEDLNTGRISEVKIDALDSENASLDPSVIEDE